MAKRIKQVGPAIKTREEMEGVVGQICELTTRRDALTVQMDEYIQEVRARYEADLSGIAKRLDELMALAREWAEANPQWFSPAKSIEMTHGTVGFRTGMPTVKTLAGWTWAKVLDAIKAMNFTYLIRFKEEVNKDAILAAVAKLKAGTDDPQLKRLGIKIVQDESFFVEPKREPREDVRQVAERTAS